MSYRNRNLLDLAHDMPCQAAFPHQCNQHLGCHPAHANWSQFGRGIGHKASDCFFAAVCGNAHRELDPKVGPKMDREQRFHEWLRAFARTFEYLWAHQKIRIA